jgi:hypothetical protein
MFSLVYISNLYVQPNVLEISQTKQTLIQRLHDKSMQQCIDEVGQKNFVNTLDKTDSLTDIIYPLYPNFALKKISDDKVEVHKIEKKQIVERGYIYNSTKDIAESSLVGTYYVVPIETWKYDDLPQRPVEEKQIVIHPLETKKSQTMIQNYDKVLLELIESIQKRKLD